MGPDSRRQLPGPFAQLVKQAGKREVRYHSLPSLGDRRAGSCYLIAVTVVGMTYPIIRYGSERCPITIRC
jgi:hypothetical protein